MSTKKHYPFKKIAQNADYKSLDDYNKEYSRSINDNSNFWSEKAER